MADKPKVPQPVQPAQFYTGTPEQKEAQKGPKQRGWSDTTVGKIIGKPSDFTHTLSSMWKGNVQPLLSGGAWAANARNWDDIARGSTRVGEAMLFAANPTHWDEVAHGVKTYGPPVAKEVIKQELKPENLIPTVMLAAASGGGSVVAKTANKFKTVREATETARAVKAAKAGKTGVEAAQAARDVERAANLTRGQRGLRKAISAGQKLDEVLTAPELAQQSYRLRASTWANKNLPGGKYIPPSALDWSSRTRLGAGQRIQEAIPEDAGKVRRVVQESFARKVAGGDTMPTTGGSFARNQFRIGKTQKFLETRGKIQSYRDITEMVAHPEQALQHGAEAVAHRYGPQIAFAAGRKMASSVFNGGFGDGGAQNTRGGETAKEETWTPRQADTYNNPWANYRPASLYDSMPASRFGPARQYEAGRGFRSPASQAVDWSKVIPRG